jgi:peptidoglycan-associated lipoprotein
MVTVDTSNLAPGVYHVDGRASLASDPSVTSSCQTTFRIREEAAGNTGPAAPAANDNSEFYKNMVDVFFDYDSEHLRPDAQAGVTKDAAYLNGHPEISFTIAGYADERGSNEYNIALGLKRAITTRKAFVEAGISESRIKVLSYGKEKPFCTEDTDSCLQQNRRAQMLPDAP